MSCPPDAPPSPFSPAEERAMRQALDQAQNAWLVGEVPVGAVILKDDADGVPQVVATGYNLPECTIVVTLEPCAMCAMALMHARFKRVVFGARDPKTGAAGSVVDLFALPQLNHQTTVAGGCLESECGGMLRQFFVERRAAHKARQAASQAPAADAAIPVADVTVDDAIPVGIATEIDPQDKGSE
jgi:tRNA(adenine34) deaminase